MSSGVSSGAGGGGGSHGTLQQQHRQQHGEEDLEDLFPPANFSMIEAGVYRSEYPVVSTRIQYYRRL